jgi:hypothetical protein
MDLEGYHNQVKKAYMTNIRKIKFALFPFHYEWFR